MPARAALSAAPHNALLFWTDGLSLFTELPGPDQRPVVIRYPLTALGLSSALGIIRTRAYDTADRTDQRPKLSTATRRGTSEQQHNASAILKRMRLIP